MTIDGTLTFSSVNVLQGNQCNEKDDLESLAYSLAYLLQGSLPWEPIEEQYHCNIKTNVISFDTIIDKIITMKKSFNINTNSNCKASVFIMIIINHIKMLSVYDKPDYNMLIDTCNELLSEASSEASSGSSTGSSTGSSKFDWYDDGISWDKDGKLLMASYDK